MPSQKHHGRPFQNTRVSMPALGNAATPCPGRSRSSPSSPRPLHPGWASILAQRGAGWAGAGWGSLSGPSPAPPGLAPALSSGCNFPSPAASSPSFNLLSQLKCIPSTNIFHSCRPFVTTKAHIALLRVHCTCNPR